MQLSCTCGRVTYEASGAPIVVAACYCDDCQEAARRIEALPNAPPLKGADGGTEYVLFRKDRVVCVQGRELVQELRLREPTPTQRAFASCCNSGLYLEVVKGHWLSLYRARVTGVAPPLQMRIQTRFKPAQAVLGNDVPAYPRFPLRFIAKVLRARLAMLLS